MTDLIKRSDVLQLLSGSDIAGYKPSALREMVELLPAIDAVPVVRCKDCTAFVPMELDEIFARCNGECYLSGCLVRNDSFCSYGERKDGGKNAAD